MLFMNFEGPGIPVRRYFRAFFIGAYRCGMLAGMSAEHTGEVQQRACRKDG